MAGFQIIEEYSSLNGVGGTCCLCNASKRQEHGPERIVTTDLVTDMPDAPEGVWPEMYMEFCESCVVEMGTLLGMMDQRKAERLVKRNAALQMENKQLQDQIDDLTSVLAATSVVSKHLERVDNRTLEDVVPQYGAMARKK